jgi:teichuronic acid biosynthesis glycosyltransferase TuaC
MKVLIVCSGNVGHIASFVKEQGDGLEKLGVDIDYFLIHGKGKLGYLRNYPAFIKKIRCFKPDLIHAHYALSGLLACMQTKVRVITTYHGNDINPINKIGHSYAERINFFSYLTLKLSIHNIFVSDELRQIAGLKDNYSVITCGVNLDNFDLRDKKKSRVIMKLKPKSKYILFSSSFDNPVKNYALAKRAIALLDECEVIEMKGYNRKEIAYLLNACDLLLVTSRNESGPLVVKEALACGCPVVSTDVGDVRDIFGNTEGCFLSSFDPIEIKDKINMAFQFALTKNRTNGRKRILELELDNNLVANKVLQVYKKVLNNSMFPNSSHN